LALSLQATFCFRSDEREDLRKGGKSIAARATRTPYSKHELGPAVVESLRSGIMAWSRTGSEGVSVDITSDEKECLMIAETIRPDSDRLPFWFCPMSGQGDSIGRDLAMREFARRITLTAAGQRKTP
jgi:hypothetical protein